MSVPKHRLLINSVALTIISLLTMCWSVYILVIHIVKCLFTSLIPRRKPYFVLCDIYLCHKGPWICPVCRNHDPVFSSFMTYHRIGKKSNTKSTTCGAGTGNPSKAHEFTPDFNRGCCCSILIFLCSVL